MINGYIYICNTYTFINFIHFCHNVRNEFGYVFVSTHTHLIDWHLQKYLSMVTMVPVPREIYFLLLTMALNIKT